MRFTNMQAKAMAFLAIRKVKAEKVAEGLYKISCGVVNGGFLNTAGTVLATRIRVTKPVEAVICGEGITIAQGKAKQELGHLPGRSEKKVEWLVQAPAGTEVTISVFGERAGKVKHVVTLEQRLAYQYAVQPLFMTGVALCPPSHCVVSIPAYSSVCSF